MDKDQGASGSGIRPTHVAEAAAFAQALRESKISMAAVADAQDVSPGLVSQWASGQRPIPATRAVSVARLLGVDPGAISQAYLADLTLAGRRPATRDDELSALRDQVEGLQIAMKAMMEVMARHRPVEAGHVAESISKQVPAHLDQEGHVAALTAALRGRRPAR